MPILLKSPTVEPRKKPKTSSFQQKEKGYVEPFSKEGNKTASLTKKAQIRLFRRSRLSKSSKKGYSDRFPTIFSDNSNRKKAILSYRDN